jgi:hypothetical protein
MLALVVLGEDVAGLAGRVRQRLAAEVAADDGELAHGDREGPSAGFAVRSA